MRKLVFIAMAAFSFNASAQKWIKVDNTDTKKDEVYNYVINNDIIAKKWTDIYTGDKFTTVVDLFNYCEVWKVNDKNHLSIIVANELMEVVKGSYYKVIVVMDDNTRIEDLAFLSYEKNRLEFILNINESATNTLKTKFIKGIKIEGATEDFILDSKENALDVEYIQFTANIIWPEITVVKT